MFGVSVEPAVHCTRLRAQHFDCIVEKRRSKLRRKKLNSESLAVYIYKKKFFDHQDFVV